MFNLKNLWSKWIDPGQSKVEERRSIEFWQTLIKISEVDVLIAEELRDEALRVSALERVELAKLQLAKLK